MTKVVSIHSNNNTPFDYKKVKIRPQQIVRGGGGLFSESIKLYDLPDDYIKFIGFFGEGLLGDYVRIFPVHFIDSLLKPWRRQSLKNKFFENNKVLSYKQLSKSLIIGDTLDNAQIIYYNGNYYMYNVEIEEFVVKVGSNINDVLEWFTKGKFWDPVELNTFVPFNSNKTVSPLSRIIGGFFYDYERKQ